MKKLASKKAKLTQVALRFLTVRPRFEAEIRAKLAPLTPDPQLIDQVIDKLKQNKFLNDQDLAKRTVNHLVVDKKKGPRYIQYKLKNLGVDKQVVDLALESIDSDLYRQAVKSIITKRFRSPQQIIRLLNSRGFTWAQIAPFIDEINQIA